MFLDQEACHCRPHQQPSELISLPDCHILGGFLAPVLVPIHQPPKPLGVQNRSYLQAHGDQLRDQVFFLAKSDLRQRGLLKKV